MNVTPQNRYLLIEVCENVPEQESAILVPKDYTAQTRQHELVKILASSVDTYAAGQCALVEAHMIKEVDIDGDVHKLILENYVLATVTDAGT